MRDSSDSRLNAGDYSRLTADLIVAPHDFARGESVLKSISSFLLNAEKADARSA
jgi:hypothetical protein